LTFAATRGAQNKDQVTKAKEAWQIFATHDGLGGWAYLVAEN
jgi:hypothetical protein